MKKRELSPVELKNVVELRQLGAKWTEIEKETNVERRAAKRAYEEWERDKQAKEQEAVRFRVAAEAFHEHMNDLIKLADSLVDALRVPKMLRGLDNAEEVLEHLLMRHIQGELEPFPISSDEIDRMVRRNKMLLKSLQDHTRGKVRWDALEEWGQARNNTVKDSEALRSRAEKVIGSILNKQPGLKKKIETAIGSNNIIQILSDGIRENIWQGVLTGKPEQVHIWIGTSLTSKGRVELQFYKNDSEMKLDLNDEELAKEVKNICRRAITKLRKQNKPDLVQKLADEVHLMWDRSKELEASLDELLLRPIILRTRCDLCPA